MTDRRPGARLWTGLVIGGLCAAGLAWLVKNKNLTLKKQTRPHNLPPGQPITNHLASGNRHGISNWGNYPKIAARMYYFEEVDKLKDLLNTLDVIIPRGNGRCYGDSALSPNIISSLRYNKFLSFDREGGMIRCQSGVTFEELLDVIVPQGWFLPVTPGTKFITVGGAIASDVHGKNQHKEGTFCDHVMSLELMLGDGSVVTCSRQENEELFQMTRGGMGLTGIILNATFRLKPIETAYIRQETIRAENLDHLMDLFEESEEWTYSVAWIDCLVKGKHLGRGILMRGEHATLEDLDKDEQWRDPLRLKPNFKPNVPFNFPGFALNSFTIGTFNTLYFHKHPARPVKSIIPYEPFFYPLDFVHNWNRIYGKRGFTQYQFVLPKKDSREGMHQILGKIAAGGMGSFLAVLKLFGKQEGYIPFAMEGYNLALDFPIKDNLFEFLDELDQLVLAYGGRLYLTKDVRMNEEMFMKSYPNGKIFMKKVRALHRDLKFRSLQSDRVGIT